jgi:hypothetical protein
VTPMTITIMRAGFYQLRTTRCNAQVATSFTLTPR